MISHQLCSVNQKNNLKLKLWEVLFQYQIDSIIKNASDAQLIWKKTELNYRISLVEELARSLKVQSKEFFTFLADEIGKPLKKGELEMNKYILPFEYYSEIAYNFFKKLY